MNLRPLPVDRQRTAATGLLALVLASSAVTVTTPASAAPAAASTAGQDVMPAFYTPPASIPTERGAIIRSEPMEYHSAPLHITQLPGTVTRVRYASRDRSGQPIAVTGTVIEPDRRGPGPASAPPSAMPSVPRASPTAAHPPTRAPTSLSTRSSA